MNYSISKKLGDVDFNLALEKTKEALKSEGFGVLFELNVKNILKEKIGKDFDEYVILGACNPNLAYQALSSNKDVGLFLPCNVVIFKDAGSVFVKIISPKASISQFIEADDVLSVANQAEEKLQRVISAISL